MPIRKITFFVALLLLAVSVFPEAIFAAAGVPKILNYQGRLMNGSGTLLGGAGTQYCFQFSLFDTATPGTGSKLWPSGATSTMAVTVKNGVFNAGIGDTNAGGDLLDYNFQDSDTVYLNVDVATKVGAVCGPGLGDEVYETLSPRQRIVSSAYALNSGTVGGFTPSQTPTGSQIPVLNGGNLTLAGGITVTNSTTTNASTSNLVISNNFTFGSISGILKSVLGVVTAALVDLATDITGILAVVNGGTGWANVASGAVLFGNGAGALATTTAGTDGQVLGYVSGIPTWTNILASTTAQGRFITGNIIATSTATSTFSGPFAIGDLATSSKLFSIVGSTTAATSVTGTAIASISNTSRFLSSGTNVLRLNVGVPAGTACVTASTCPRFIEYFAGVGPSQDTGGTGVGSLRLNTTGTGITQTSGSADFAEFMQLSESASTGDLVSLNSSGQYQKAVAGQSLIGVISDNPAFVANAGIEGNTNAYIVGFAGVVPTTVSTDNGNISAGDLITAGAVSGVGIKLTNSGYAVGQALEAWSGPGNGTINVLVFPKYVDAAVALNSYGGSGGGISGYFSLATSTGVVNLASTTYSFHADRATTTYATTTYFAVTGTATSTFGGGIRSSALDIFGSATSTFGNGINLATGCFAVGGTCITGTGGSSASSTLLADSNTFSGNNTFSQALSVTASATSTFANGIQLSGGCFRDTSGQCITGGGGGGSGVLINIQVFSSPGTTTYTATPGATHAQVVVTGGGGGGAGVDASNATTVEVPGGGGGAGGTSIYLLDLTSTSSVQVVVGAGGAGGPDTAGNGNSGTYSWFGQPIIVGAEGGFGGTSITPDTNPAPRGLAGGVGAVASTSGSIKLAGGSGLDGMAPLNDQAFGGSGGTSYWGAGGGGGTVTVTGTQSAGTDGSNAGSGGGGAALADTLTGAAGGNGAAGSVVVYEYGPFNGIMQVGHGGTGLADAPTFGQLLLGNAVGGYTLTATSSLGFFSTQNSWTALQAFSGGASSTNISVSGTLFAETASTTNLSVVGQATSTFGGGIRAKALDIFGTATSTYGNGINLATGCFSIAGVCLTSGGGGGAQVNVANTWTALQTFSSGASSTNISVSGTLFAETASTTNLSVVGQATSTFAGGIQTKAFNITGTATSTAVNGFNIASGCFSINGTCIGAGGAATWGAIGGTLSDQTDLQAALDAKLSLTAWYATTTDGLAQGSLNKYYSTLLFASDLAATTTDALDEGVTNRYYTDTRVGSYISGSSTVPHVGGVSFGDLLTWSGSAWTTRATSTLAVNTSDVFEGSNLFFTNNRVASVIAGTTTTALAEGSNLYFTNNRVATVIAGTTTDAIDEGSVNKYFSNALVGAYISSSSTIPHVGGVSFGDLLTWNGSAWTIRATSTLGIALSDTTGTLPESRGGTNQVSYTKGDILYASADNVLAKLPIGNNGEVLKVTGAGIPSWGIDLTSGGGGAGTGYFSTTTNSLAIFPTDPAYVVMIGQTTTSTIDSIFEVSGRSYFSNRVGIATTSPGSIFSINDVINFTSATTTMYGTGLNLASGCFAIAGTCIGAGGATSWGSITGTLSDQTDLQNALNAKLSLSAWYATTTDGLAQGTLNKYYSTLLFATDLAATTTDALDEGSTNLYFTNNRVASVIAATTTDALDEGVSNLYFSNNRVATVLAATTTDAIDEGSVNKYFSNALVNSFAHSSTTISKTFTANAFTALQTFSIGLVSQASSTIGDGTRGGGLTISGGATTTGTAYFAGNVGIGTTSPGSILSINGVANFGTATSTLFGSGLNLKSGCFAILDQCIGAGGGGVTLGNSSPWTQTQTFAQGFVSQASSTVVGQFNATQASTTQLTVSGNTNLAQATTTNLAITTISSGLLATSPNGSVIPVSIGASLTFSSNTLGLNLSNPNIWSGLQTFGNASTTQLSVLDRIYIGGTATTTLQGNITGTSTLQGFINVTGTNSTSTFSGNVMMNGRLQVSGQFSNTSNATSSFANGINITNGCFSVNGVCIGGSSGTSGYTIKLAAIYATSSAGTTTVQFTGVAGSNPSFSNGTLTIGNNVAYYSVEAWGAGGGGAAQATNNGGDGGTTCFAQGSIACGGTSNKQLTGATGGTGGAAAAGAGGTGGNGTVGALREIGGSGSVGGSGGNAGNGVGVGGNAAHGGGMGGAAAISGATGEAGEDFGGGGQGGRTTATGGSGGGGGGYAMDVASTSVKTTSTFSIGAGGAGGAAGTVAGGAGGPGGIVMMIYATSTFSSAGNDYAEMFPVSDPIINAGDIVAVDAGMPVSMKLAAQGDIALVGVIATQPGQLLGDINAVGERPVALAGRVPVKVSLEGGPIKIGDRIAASSVAGVGKKAEQSDDTVGIAIDTYDGSQEHATVMVFLDLQKGNVEKMDTLVVNAIEAAEKDVKVKITEDGRFIIEKKGQADMSITFDNASTTESVYAVSIDALGNALFAGALTAANFEVGSAEKPGGITMYDSATGAPYCIQIIGGTLKTVAGKCGAPVMQTETSLPSVAGASIVADDIENDPDQTTALQRSSPPIIRINGNNPSRLEIGTSYVDLGVTVSDDHDDNLAVRTFVDDVEVQDISLDTSTSTLYVIRYRVTDNDGNVSVERRIVVVGDGAPTDPQAEPVVTEEIQAQESASSTEPVGESAPITPPVEESAPLVTEAPSASSEQVEPAVPASSDTTIQEEAQPVESEAAPAEQPPAQGTPTITPEEPIII